MSDNMTSSDAALLMQIRDGGKLQAIAKLGGVHPGTVCRIARAHGYVLNVSTQRFEHEAPAREPLVKASDIEHPDDRPDYLAMADKADALGDHYLALAAKHRRTAELLRDLYRDTGGQ